MTEASLWLVVFLVVLLALQQVYYLSQIQKLVDKVMSRSYTEYKRAEKQVDKPIIRISDEPAEDLSTIGGSF